MWKLLLKIIITSKRKTRIMLKYINYKNKIVETITKKSEGREII